MLGNRTTPITSWLLIVTLVSWLATPGACATETVSAEDFRGLVERLSPEMIELRHQVHQHPELSNREFQTSALVATKLRELGLEVQTGIAHTGVVGVLRGGRKGPTAAVRSELDALPVTENTSLPFKSTVRSTYNGQEVGVAHACGHDIHIASILGVAAVLASMRTELPGAVMFIFQPAEEGLPMGEEGGAKLMLKEGIFARVHPDAIFGMHAFGTLDVGQVEYSLGPANAASASFEITFHGKQAHAAFPQDSVDPVVMAAEAVMVLQTIRSRNLSPYDPAVVSVTMIHAGLRTNIIPEQAQLEGTVRVFDDRVQRRVEQRMREIADGVARGGGGTAEVRFEQGYPVVFNDTGLAKRVLPAVERAVGAANVHLGPPVMASDDFAYFAQVVPAFFFRFGTQKPGTKSGINHAPNFEADDSAIPIGMRVMTEVILEFLRTTHDQKENPG